MLNNGKQLQNIFVKNISIFSIKKKKGLLNKSENLKQKELSLPKENTISKIHLKAESGITRNLPNHPLSVILINKQSMIKYHLSKCLLSSNLLTLTKLSWIKNKTKSSYQQLEHLNHSVLQRSHCKMSQALIRIAVQAAKVSHLIPFSKNRKNKKRKTLKTRLI